MLGLAQRVESLRLERSALSPAARAYIACVCAAGLVILCLPSPFPLRDPVGLLAFLLLGALAQLLPIQFYKNVSISMSMAVALAAILVFGPTYATWVNFASGVVHYLAQIRPYKRPFYRSTLTTSTLILSAWTTGQVYVSLGGVIGPSSDSFRSFIILVLSAVVYYLINTGLITLAMALEQKRSFWGLLKTNYQWLTVNVAGLAPLGFGIAEIYQRINLPGLALFLLPTVLAWYSFHLYSKSIDQVRKANEDLKVANDCANKANQDLQKANESIHETNAELTKANERLNVMYQVSRSFVKSLRLDETLDRIVEGTKLIGFSAGFVAGPLSEKGSRIQHWHTASPAFAQWALSGQDKLAQTRLGRVVSTLAREKWFVSGEPRAVNASDYGLQWAEYVSSAEQDQLSSIALVPLLVRGDSWWVVGVGSKDPPTQLEMKELGLFRSMAENAVEMALAHEQAQLDALMDTRTGLFNHRYFQEAIQREIDEAAKRNGFFSFLMLDVDNFKVFNDVYGHLVGDQVLEVVARLIRESVRESDIVCRYGGDEMCVLLPYTDRSRGMEIASRVDRAIRSYAFHARRESGTRKGEIEELSLRVSIGLATFPESGQTRASLIEQADRACYKAKRLGGGVVAEPPIEPSSERLLPMHLLKRS